MGTITTKAATPVFTAQSSSLVFQNIIQLIQSVLARADGVYMDAQGYLDAIAAGTSLAYAENDGTVVDTEAYSEPAGIDIVEVPVSISMGVVTKPTIPALSTIATDTVDLAEVNKPEAVILGTINTVVPVDPVLAPRIIFIEPDIPVVPSLSDVPEPDLSFEYNEAWYTSELGSTLYANLLDELKNGSTGLTYSVEADIYNRDFERDTLELQRTKDKIANIWSESGMSLPDGVLVSALNAAEIDFQNKYSDKSRDVRIESFKRADDNAKFVKDLTVKFEQVITDYMGKYYDRKLEAAKATLTYAQAIYDSLIKYQALYIERYKAETEGYKAIVEGQAAVSDAKAKVYASEVQYELGVAEIGVKNVAAELDVQKNKIAKGQLDVAVYDSEIKYAVSDAEIEVKSIAADIDVQKNILGKGQLDVALYDSEIKYESAYAEIEAKEVAMQLEKQKTAAAVYQAEVQFSDVDMRYHLGKAEIAMKTVQANIELLKMQVQAAVAATGNIAQVSSTMVAGSLSALNANTSIGLTESYGNSYGQSSSESKSTSQSQSTSVSTSYDHNYEE